MNQLEYIPGIGGQKSIPMDGPSAFVGTADGLRSRKWQYDLGYRGLLNATRPAREVDVDFVSDYETADALRRVADADVAARTPGVFVAQNEWRQNAYIVESEPTNIHYGWLSTTLKALLLDGAWWRIVSKSFRPENTVIDKQYIVKTAYNSVSAAGAADAPLNALTVCGKAAQASKPKNGVSVPIEVVQGQNILDPSNIIRCYISTSSTTIKATGTSVYAEVEAGETYTFTRNGGDRFYRGFTTDIPATGVSVSNVTKCGNGTTDLTVTFTAPSGVNYVILYVDNSSTFTPDEYQLERGSESSQYVPYGCIGLDVGGSITPIDLDGNVLASLLDGTQDVLKVSSNGVVTIEKRVGVVDMSTLTWTSGGAVPAIYYKSNEVSSMKPKGNNECLYAEKFAQSYAHEVTDKYNSDTYIIGATSSSQKLYAKTNGLASPSISPDGLCYYPLAQPQEITLGSIAMPTLTNYSTIELVASMGATITVKYETSPSVWLDYPHDYEYDFLARSAAASVETSVLTDCDVRLVIYGQCDNPYVVIGGNRYQVNCGVPAGAYLTIDGREKTIILTLEDGTTVNVFGDGVRGSGLGSGEYVFEPIQPGAQNVEWDGSFGFDLGWYEEEGEPPWSQS